MKTSQKPPVQKLKIKSKQERGSLPLNTYYTDRWNNDDDNDEENEEVEENMVNENVYEEALTGLNDLASWYEQNKGEIDQFLKPPLEQKRVGDEITD